MQLEHTVWVLINGTAHATSLSYFAYSPEAGTYYSTYCGQFLSPRRACNLKYRAKPTDVLCLECAAALITGEEFST